MPRDASCGVIAKLVAIAAVSACNQPVVEAPPVETRSFLELAMPTIPLVDGIPTTERPEIGRLNSSTGHSCTATLVAPTIAITAAHCLDFTSRDYDGAYGTVELAGRTRSIRQVNSLGNAAGLNDIALVVLDGKCQSIKPARLLAAFPTRGTRIDVYGFGCTRRTLPCAAAGTGGGEKQVVHEYSGRRKCCAPETAEDRYSSPAR